MALNVPECVDPPVGITPTKWVAANDTAEFRFNFHLLPGAGKRTVITAEIIVNEINLGQPCECVVELK